MPSVSKWNWGFPWWHTVNVGVLRWSNHTLQHSLEEFWEGRLNEQAALDYKAWSTFKKNREKSRSPSTSWKASGYKLSKLRVYDRTFRCLRLLQLSSSRLTICIKLSWMRLSCWLWYMKRHWGNAKLKWIQPIWRGITEHAQTTTQLRLILVSPKMSIFRGSLSAFQRHQ